MKYTINRSEYFGYDYDVYDSEALTMTTTSGCGNFETTRVKTLTAAEMKKFAHERYVTTLEKMRRELGKLQEKYDEELKKIQDFENSILTTE